MIFKQYDPFIRFETNTECRQQFRKVNPANILLLSRQKRGRALIKRGDFWQERYVRLFARARGDKGWTHTLALKLHPPPLTSGRQSRKPKHVERVLRLALHILSGMLLQPCKIDLQQWSCPLGAAVESNFADACVCGWAGGQANGGCERVRAPGCITGLLWLQRRRLRMCEI